jgi:hypothetical protein
MQHVNQVMNKEDKQDHVLTFPSWLANFIPNLHITLQGLISLPGKSN